MVPRNTEEQRTAAGPVDGLGLGGDPWRIAHAAAWSSPTGDERAVVGLCVLADLLSRQHSEDYVMREGVADIIKGTIVLLDGPTGRLDCGLLSEHLRKCADRIDFDLDVEEFRG